jgi:hypothetical protein
MRITGKLFEKSPHYPSMTLFRSLGLFFLAAALLLTPMGCKEEETLQDLNARKLINNWQIGTTGNVRFDLDNVTSEFSAFQISFTGDRNGGGYSTVGGQDVFDASGTWSFIPDNPNGIRLTGTKVASNRNVVMVFSGANLILDFTVSASAEERKPGDAIIKSIPGRYRFELSPR